MKRIISLVLLLMIVFVMQGYALELTKGKMKLILHEDVGRFSLYYLTDVRRTNYTPLFLDEDPRTSFLTVLEGNKTYRMGEAYNFTQEVEETENGGAFIWTSNQLEIREEFSFISSPSSALSDGFTITITIENISEQNLSVGCNYVFDTYLGERDNTHFFADGNLSIENETEFSSRSMPGFIVSGGKDKTPGFQIMLNGRGITTPDRIVAANWKRLSDGGWGYTVNSQRNFNQLPYSINDSALSIYYNARRIERGQTQEIVMAMGHYSSEGFSLSGERQKTEISDVFTKTLNTEPQTGDTELSVQTDLLTVRDLIKEINQILQSDETVSESELEVMNQVIEELEKRKSRYENR